LDRQAHPNSRRLAHGEALPRRMSVIPALCGSDPLLAWLRTGSRATLRLPATTLRSTALICAPIRRGRTAFLAPWR
jgi:hypothetical protein